MSVVGLVSVMLPFTFTEQCHVMYQRYGHVDQLVISKTSVIQVAFIFMCS